jgi:hypothetical protein
MKTRTLRAAVPAAVAVLAVLVLAVLALPAVAEQTRTVTRSFTADGSHGVRLGNLAGAVKLVAGSGDAVEVVATVHAEGDSEAETGRLLAAMQWVRDPDKGGWALAYPVDDYHRFRYPSPHGTWFGSSNTTTKYLGERVTVSNQGGVLLYADLEITYPARIPLKVRQVMGDVRGGDLYGTLSVDTGSSDVRLDSFNGALSVDTGSGDITVGSFRGSKVVFDTGSGDIDLSHVDAETLSADTGSGDVTVRDGRVGDFDADTGSGDVKVDGVAVRTARLDTGSGDVLLRGSLAEATRIVADTGSGDVEIYGDRAATFYVTADQGSGDLSVGYEDAELEYDGRHHRKVIAARRGNAQTRIEIDTGSGDAVVSPAR